MYGAAKLNIISESSKCPAAYISFEPAQSMYFRSIYENVPAFIKSML